VQVGKAQFRFQRYIAVSTKNKIDRATIERIERKLDRFLERLARLDSRQCRRNKHRTIHAGQRREEEAHLRIAVSSFAQICDVFG
jgi:hypothetical protein